MREKGVSSPSTVAGARIGKRDRAGKVSAAVEPQPLLRGPDPLPRIGKVGGRGRMAVGLVDAKALRRQGLATILAGSGGEVAVREAADAAELLADGREAAIELVLLCIGGADIDEPWVRQQLDLLMRDAPALPVLVIADREGIADVARALLSGIRGYIPTSVDTRIALEVLRLVRAGGTFIPAQAFLRSFQGEPAAPADDGTARGPAGESGNGSGSAASHGTVVGDGGAALPPDRCLTRRQLDVLRLVCRGKPNKVIAHDLRLEESTVKVHLRDIMRKLGTGNRTQLALLAARLFGGGADLPPRADD
jgi:DNA-binding NarL/FixJ family response regulator